MADYNQVADLIEKKLLENNDIDLKIQLNETKYEALLQEVMKLKTAPVAVEQTSERPPRSIESLEYEIKIAALELKVMRANIANNSKCLKDCISNIDSNKQYTMIDNLYITGLKNIPKRLYGYKFTVWVTQQICRLLPCLDFDMVPDYISVAHPIFNKDGEMTDTIIVVLTGMFAMQSSLRKQRLLTNPFISTSS